MSRISQQNARLVYQNAVNMLKVNKIGVDPARLTQGTLRGEVLATTTTANYHIPVLSNDQVNGVGAYNTEIRLALQDAFVVSDIYIGYGVPTSSTDNAFKLGTFDDASILTTANSPRAIINMYNGYMQVNFNNNTVLPNWDIYRHYIAPFTQGLVGVTAQTVFNVTQMRGAEDGFFPVEPNLVFNGAGNIDVRLVLPSAISTLTPLTRLIVIFRGVKAQNVTTIN
jgi:hypothetical protein